MALADTARLIASLELQDKFSATASRFNSTVSGLERRTATFDRLGSQIGQGLRNTTQNLTRIGVAGVGLLTVAITNGVQSLERLENAQAQTEAVLKSTNSTAGQTAKSVRNLAEKYEGLNATIDDKVIQSSENLLLTFTNIKDKAFEPALEAILNINQALGGGEEGLQNVTIQVGKALQDPIRGLTNLRRIGINFTQQQQDQIKKLVAANDLYGAQQIILQELGTEFGGSFARAGDTAAGKFAKVKDAVEDAQAALATAFLPLLVKVADKLGTFLSDPAVIQRIEDFGGQLAGGLEKVIAVGGSLPWKEIGDAFTIVGTGSKALLDAFLGLPPWVQTAVLTGWGLNKLTGGALTGIAGTITKALVTGGFGGRGSTPLNPLFVQQVGGGPGGLPGLPVVPAAAGTAALGGLAGTIAAIAIPAGVVGLAIARQLSGEPNVIGSRLGFKPGETAADLKPLTLDQTATAIQDGTVPLKSEFSKSRATGADLLRLQRSENARRVSEAMTTIGYLTGIQTATRATAGKDFSPKVNVNVSTTANISVSNIAKALYSFSSAASVRREFVEAGF